MLSQVQFALQAVIWVAVSPLAGQTLGFGLGLGCRAASVAGSTGFSINPAPMLLLVEPMEELLFTLQSICTIR